MRARPPVREFYQYSRATKQRLTNTESIGEGAWTVPSSIPERYNTCCWRRAAGVSSEQPRRLATVAISTDTMIPTTVTTVRCYGCYGQHLLPKHRESTDSSANVTDVTDVTPNRKGCMWRVRPPALARPRSPVVDTPLNCRNIRNIRNIGGRRRGVLLRQQNLGVTSVTSGGTNRRFLPDMCYGGISRWSA